MNESPAGRHLPFRLITLAVFIALPGYILIQDGMFMDAVLYTSVAHNEAQGIGSFWFPVFGELNLGIRGPHTFHEQPPLVFGIVSLFFRLLGSSMYVERFYVLLTTCITAALIHHLWQAIFSADKKAARFSWLAILLWITTPTIFWSASNNVNENTMGIFTLSAVICAFHALKSSGRRASGLWLCSGALITLASLSKGFPGFFPIGVPFFYWLSTKRIRFKAVAAYTFLLLLVPICTYAVLFLVPVSRESLSVYLFERAFYRIAENPTAGYRLQSVESLVCDLLPQLCLLLLLAGIAKLKKIGYVWMCDPRLVLFLAYIGLSASLPLMFTMVQKPFYLIPCFPFWAIAGAMVMMPYCAYFIERIKMKGTGFRLFRGLSMLLLCGSLVFVMAMKGKTGREWDRLHDAHTVGKIIPHHAAITITSHMLYHDWDMQCYLMRYYNISGSDRPAQPTLYLMMDKGEQADRDISGYNKMELGLKRYDLYKLKQ